MSPSCILTDLSFSLPALGQQMVHQTLFTSRFLRPGLSAQGCSCRQLKRVRAFCRGPVLLRAPPTVVEALLAGMPAGASAATQLDALQSQVRCPTPTWPTPLSARPAAHLNMA